MLEQERRRAEQEAARLEEERQAALLAKEELARQAENQKKSQEQLVSTHTFFSPLYIFNAHKGSLIITLSNNVVSNILRPLAAAAAPDKGTL